MFLTIYTGIYFERRLLNYLFDAKLNVRREKIMTILKNLLIKEETFFLLSTILTSHQRIRSIGTLQAIALLGYVRS